MPLINITFIKFATKDYDREKFWDEYSKRRKKDQKSPTLDTQSIKLYQADHNWKYAEKFLLKNTEFLEIIEEIEEKFACPFMIIDVRESSEFMIYKLPLTNKKGATIPIIYRDSREILTDYFEDFPTDKHLVIIDSIGLRSRRVASFLLNEGYKSIYVEGGYDMFIPIAKNKL